jgi:hypothetical protein
MKKFLSVLLLAIASIGMLRAENDTVLIGNLYYILDANKPEATVTYKSENATAQSTYAIGDLTIPSSVTYNGQDYTVISIGQAAFANCTGLTSVVVPNSVRSLVADPRAQFTGPFYNCQNLRSVTLPDTLSYFGAYSFSYCLALEEINIPVVDDIFPDVFQNCESLKRVVIPEGAWRISNHAFDGCRGMQFVEIPSTVERIGENAFANCISLDTVCCLATTPPQLDGETKDKEVFYHSGKARGQNTYYGIKYMKVFVPLESINAYKAAEEWSDCLNIYAIGYDVYEANGLCFKRDPLNQTAEVTWKAYQFGGASTEQVNYVSGDLVIPETFTDDHGITYTVTSIGEHAFANCRYLTSVQMPNTITTINEYAFAFCYSLASVIFPTGLRTIEPYAFDGTHLTSLVLPEGLQTINYHAFLDCSYLTELDIPSSVTEIGYGAFASNTSLRKIFARMTTPPAIESTVFGSCADNLKDVKCYVPDASFSTYQTTGAWNDLDLLLMSSYKLPISSVAMTVVWPQMGTAVTSNAPYGPNDITTTTLPEDIHYTFNSFYFYDADGNTFTETTLQPRTTYTVRVTVSANIGYEFADDVVISINRAAPTQRNNTGTTLSFVTSFTTTNGQTIVSDGGLTGLFSISADKKVVFSKGNLQYHAVQDKWQFAEHQYDTIGGGGNANISPTYDGWIDLFGWGTGDDPTKISENNADYSEFHDWGSNAISNGGNQPNLWRTMTDAEWNYIISERSDAANLIGNADINGNRGIILLPDNFVCPITTSFNPTSNRNTYTLEQWADMEAEGAIFLPCTGIRSTLGNKNWGYYWTSSTDDITGQRAIHYEFYYSDKTLTRVSYDFRRKPCVVRLVQEPRVELSDVSLEFEAPQAGQTISKTSITPDDEEFNVVGHVSVPANAGYEVASYCFFNQSGQNFTGTFEASTSYKAMVRLRAKDGYTFPMQSANPTTPNLNEITILVNGETPENPRSWNTGEVGAGFSFTIAAPTYTVRFLDWDGTILSTQTVEQGKDAVAPADPTREGYIFAGWDRDFTNIQANTFIAALYKQIVSNIVLTFDFPKVGETVTSTEIVITPEDADYNVVGHVALPAGVGYEVTGYGYGTSEGHFAGTFATNQSYHVGLHVKAKDGYSFPVLASNPSRPDVSQVNATINGEPPTNKLAGTGEIVLRVNFVPQAIYTVRFIDWDGTVLSTQTLLAGEDAVAPAFPSHSGYYFAGWDREFTNVQADIDVTAQYLQAIAAFEPTFVFPAAGDTVTNDVITPTHELYNVLGQISVPDGVPFHVRSYQFTDANSNYINSNSFGSGTTYSVQIILEPNEGYAFYTSYEWDWANLTFSVNGQAPYALMPAPDGGVRFWVRFETGKIPVREVKVVTTLPQAGDSILSGPCYSTGSGAVHPLTQIMNFTSGLDEAGYFCDGVDIWADDGYNPFEEEALLPNTNYFARFYVTAKDNYIFPADLNTVDVTVNDSTPLDLYFTGFEKDRIMFSVWFNSGSYKLLDVEAFVTFPAAGQPTKYEILPTDSLFNIVGQATVPDGANYSVAKYAFYAEDGNLIEESTFLPNTNYRMSVIIRPNENYAFPKNANGYVDHLQLNSTLINGEPVVISVGTETIGLETFFTTGNLLIHEVDVESMVFPKVGENVSNLIVTLADESHCTIDGMYIYNKDNSWPFGNDALEANTEYSAQVSLVPEEGYAFADDVAISVAGNPAAKILADASQQIFYVLFTPVQLITEVNLTVEAPKAGDAVLACHNYDPATSDVATVNCPPGAPYTCTKYVFYKEGECFDEAQLLGETTYMMGMSLTAAEGCTFPSEMDDDGYERVINEQIRFIINGVEVHCAERTVGVANCYLEFTTGKTEGLNNVEGDDSNVRKIMRNGILYIERNGHTYNACGQEVR